MKKINAFFLLGILMLSGFYLKAQNATKYIRFGIVPYQLFSRSTGAYISYKSEKYVLEYRPTYTIATKNKSLPYIFNWL